MRFQRLGFAAFGPFTGLSLDLSGGAPGGFHIVFGPNEAGKSSALRGVHDLLFGFPERTPDAHVHPNSELRIEAVLASESGEAVHVQRLKRRKDALRDGAGTPLDEQVMRSLLGGVDARLFERLFGLDHERLRAAGEALLNDQGDVGESLFDAGSGGRGIRNVLEELASGADEIWKPRSTKSSLNVLLESYKQAKLETRDALVSPEKWLLQKQQLEVARSRLEDLTARRKTLREESNSLSRLEAVLGPIAQRNALREKLDALGTVPLLVEDASERRLRAQRTLDQAAADRARLDREIAKKQERLSALVMPENLLGVSPEAIEKLRDRVGKFRAAEEDLPRRREEARRHELELSRLVSLLYPGQPLDSLEALRPSPTELSRVRRLPQRQATLLERVANTKKAIRGLVARRAQAQAALRELPPVRELGRLGRLLSDARAKGDLERRVRETALACDKLETEASVRVAALSGYSGTLEELSRLELPEEETIERFQHEFAERAARSAELERDHGAVMQRLAHCEEKIQAIEGSGSVPSEAVLDAARARRDQGLQRVLDAWSAGAAVSIVHPEFAPELPLVEGFVQAIRAADDHADRLRREVERVSLRATLLAESGRLRAESEQLLARRERLSELGAVGEAAWRAAFRPSGIEPRSPLEMRAWLARQRQLADLALRLAQARAEALSAREERHALSRELGQAFGEQATDASLGSLLARCEEAVQSDTRVADKRRELEEVLKEIDRQKAEQEQELAAEHETLQAWEEEWSAATRKLGFPIDLSPDEVVTRLDSLSLLFDGLVQLGEQRRRATRIEEDRAKFEAHVSEWVETYAPDLDGRAPDVAAEELVRRFQAAEHQRAEHAQIQTDLTELVRSLTSLEALREQAELELESLRVAAHASDLALLPAIEAQVVEARNLRRELDAVEGSLLKDEGVPLEALLHQARGVDRAALQVRLGEIREQLERLDEDVDDANAQVRQLDAGLQLYADSDASDRAQDLMVQAAQIREQALRYARLKLSSSILQREVERYREQHQGPVLKRASSLFPRLTLGRFRGLRVGVEERQIVCLREDGKEVGVDGLSEGTRYQLYLALRVASLERYLERNPPLPFVLDDILIHFDDERAAAALGVLGELAERSQILFFTHHARDLALAAQAIPSTRLFRHALSGHLPG